MPESPLREIKRDDRSMMARISVSWANGSTACFIVSEHFVLQSYYSASDSQYLQVYLFYFTSLDML
jgi:hypothetical protein